MSQPRLVSLSLVHPIWPRTHEQSIFPASMALLSRLRPVLRPSAYLRLRRPSIRRSLYLAPPYLVDDYIPRYHLLSSVDASKKRSLAYAHLRECNLCPRLCGVNRYEKTGVCLIGAETVKVGTIAPHFGEEPFIQGHNGSGSVFFSGCNLRCVFCQVCAARTEDDSPFAIY